MFEGSLPKEVSSNFRLQETVREQGMKRHFDQSPSEKQHVTPELDLKGSDWAARRKTG